VSVGHALGDDDVVDAVLEALPKRSDIVVDAIQTADKMPWRYWSDQARYVVRGYQPSSTVKTTLTRTRKVAQKNAETIGYYFFMSRFLSLVLFALKMADVLRCAWFAHDTGAFARESAEAWLLCKAWFVSAPPTPCPNLNFQHLIDM
jgi:hypothetical protein